VAETIIDQLKVVLGLDASKFTEGQKQASSTIADLKRTVTSSAGEMGSALLSVAGKLSAFFLGFEGLRGVIDLVKNTAYEFKQAGISAELLGTSVQKTRIAEEFSQLAGAGPTALSDFVQQGRMRLSALTLGGINPAFLPALIGLNPLTAFQGSPTDIFARFQNAAASHAAMLQTIMPGASTPKMAAQQILQMLGFSPAMAAEATNRQHAEQDLTTAIRDNIGVTNKQAEAGRADANALISLKTRVENAAAALGFGPLGTLTHLVSVAFGELLHILNEIENSGIVKWFESTGEGWISKAWSVYKQGGQEESDLENKAWNWLKGVWSRTSSALALPAALSMPALHFANSAVAAAGVPTASLIGPGGQGGTNNSFTIGSIQVNTAATDAKGIAAAIGQETQRKFIVTQADTGMVA
jgi:hypothetical protein